MERCDWYNLGPTDVNEESAKWYSHGLKCSSVTIAIGFVRIATGISAAVHCFSCTPGKWLAFDMPPRLRSYLGSA